MSLIIPETDILGLKVTDELKHSLIRDEAPYLVSVVFSDGEVQRWKYSSESELRRFLTSSGIVLLGGEVEKLLRFSERIGSAKASILAGEGATHDVELIIEQIMPATRIIIFGAGHVGKAVVQVSAQMGWDVIIIDDRSEFLDRIGETQANIKMVNGAFGDVLESLSVGRTSALVIVTRGHQFDEICLEEGLRTEAFYIGMIGSRRRVASILKRLEDKGIQREKLLGIHAPIGIDINARTPQEIAISIIAEIIRVKNSTGQPG